MTSKAEARSAALGVNRELLTGLLGRAALRDLLEPDAVAEVTARLTRTSPGWRARDHDEVADMLRRFGDLTRDELVARSETEVDAALAELGTRVAEVQGRWVVADEAADLCRQRDDVARRSLGDVAHDQHREGVVNHALHVRPPVARQAQPSPDGFCRSAGKLVGGQALCVLVSKRNGESKGVTHASTVLDR